MSAPPVLPTPALGNQFANEEETAHNADKGLEIAQKSLTNDIPDIIIMKDRFGMKLAKGVVFFSTVCGTCQKDIMDGEALLALGKPYFCPVHQTCLTRFIYDKRPRWGVEMMQQRQMQVMRIVDAEKTLTKFMEGKYWARIPANVREAWQLMLNCKSSDPYNSKIMVPPTATREEKKRLRKLQRKKEKRREMRKQNYKSEEIEKQVNEMSDHDSDDEIWKNINTIASPDFVTDDQKAENRQRIRANHRRLKERNPDTNAESAVPGHDSDTDPVHKSELPMKNTTLEFKETVLSVDLADVNKHFV